MAFVGQINLRLPRSFSEPEKNFIIEFEKIMQKTKVDVE